MHSLRCRWALALLGLLFVVVIGSAVADADADDICKQESPCRCVNSQGMGIDLNVLADATKYLMTPGPINQITYYFHPCKDIELNVTNDAGNQTVTVRDSTLFAFNHADSQLVGLGQAASTRIVHDAPNNALYLAITHKTLTTGDPNNTLITLACTTSAQDNLFYQSETQLILYSKHACIRLLAQHNGRSTGTVLLIVFFSLAIGYLLLGMLANFYLVGARGIEMIPNLGFWRDLPQLIREGVAFLQNGCRPSARDDLLSPTESRSPHHPDSYVAI